MRDYQHACKWFFPRLAPAVIRVVSGLHLNMDVEDFVKAVMLIATSNGCKAQYIVPVKDNYSHTYDILILESNGKLLDELHKAGYSLSMSSKGLVVNKF